MSPLDERSTGLLFRNLSMLVLVALPLAVLTLMLNEFLLTGDGQASSLLDLALPYLLAVLPLLFGGFIHQIVALSLSRSWSVRKRRITALVTSPIVVSVCPLFLEFSYFLRLALPVFVGPTVYNALLRLPCTSDR